jgi:hypothetical protein
LSSTRDPILEKFSLCLSLSLGHDLVLRLRAAEDEGINVIEHLFGKRKSLFGPQCDVVSGISHIFLFTAFYCLSTRKIFPSLSLTIWLRGSKGAESEGMQVIKIPNRQKGSFFVI